MKNSRKGFSLIELLAVVIILAILALITIPIVGNLLKQARINAAVVSAYGYVEATNNEVVSKQTKGENVLEKQYDIKDYSIVGESLNVKYEGKGPEKGYFNVARSKVKDGVFCINGYEIKYENGKAEYDPDGSLCQKQVNLVCKLKSGKLIYDDTELFEIETIDDLVCLSEEVANGRTFEGKTIVLNNDLDFNSKGSYLDADQALETPYTYNSVQIKTYKENLTIGRGFTTIGSDSKQFKGIFNGNEKTISNLKIKRSGSSYVGLFGYLNDSSVVSYLTLKDSSISGYAYVGSIAGYMYNGTIKNIILNNVSINSSNNYSGGIAGYNDYGTIKTVIFDNTTSMNGTNYVGGIVGQNAGGTVNEVYINGTISGTSYVGGVAGINSYYKYPNTRRTAYIYNAVVNANVTATSGTVGGMVGCGYSDRNYAYGVIEGGSITGTSSRTGKAVGYNDGNNYFNGLVYVSGEVTITGSGGLNGNGYSVTKQVTSLFDDVLDTWYDMDGNNTGYYFDYESDDSNKMILFKVNDNSFKTSISGSGTEEDPYLIKNEKDFKDAAILAKGSNYFKINNDIDVSTFKHFYPIATTSNYFNGVLDGNDKTISNLNLGCGQYSGFVGYLNNGTIKNINFYNSSIKNYYGSITGFVVGNMVSGVVSTISLDTVTVNGYDTTGGVVGLNDGGTIKTIITDNLTVSGSSTVGGITGQNLGTINEVIVKGSVSGTGTVGGITGYAGKYQYYGTYWNSYIYNAVVNANITATGGTVGGMFGRGYRDHSPVYGVIQGGTITGTSSQTGKIVGYNDGDSGISGLVYVSNQVTLTGSGGLNGNGYDSTKEVVALFDDVLDTWYDKDGNNTGYYFDFESPSSNYLALLKVSEHPFTTSIAGSGTEEDPYIVSSESDFKDVAILAKGSNYFKLGSNVDTSTFNHFYPLSTTNNYFNGIFDGDSKTITNLNIGCGQYCGLIGHLNQGTIKNLTIKDSLIKNYYGGRTGLVAGTISSGVISTIILDTVTINGYDTTGGVAGLNDAGTIKTIITKDLSVNGSSTVGGITGQNLGTINEVFVKGSISGSGTVGGITGYAGKYQYYGTYWNSYIYNAVLNANITATGGTVGGMFGRGYRDHSLVYGVIQGGTITGTSSQTGKIVGYNDGDSGISGLVYVSNQVTLTGSGGINGTIYNPSKELIALYDDVLDTWYDMDGNNTGYYFDFESPSSNYLALLKVSEHPFTNNLSGSGTEEDPYIVSSESDFKDVAILAKGTNYFKLGSNVDTSTFNHFYPLSSTSNYFNGVFDGDGKTISNLNIGCGQYCGLFGYLNQGSVKHLVIKDSNINTYYGSGRNGLVAGNTSSANIFDITLDNSTIAGTNYTGGVTGYNDGTIKTIISKDLTISGNGYCTGGIVGHNNGTVEEVLVRGSITSSSSYVGGVAGVNGRSVSTFQQAPGYIYSALVNANITGTSDTGGMVGRGYKNYLYGVVEGGTITGGSNTGKTIGSNDGDIYSLVYVSNLVTKTGNGNYNGNEYDSSKQVTTLYDDVLDTWYDMDGNNTGYYFDYESASSNNMILVKKSDHPFTNNLSGSGTEADPYIISSESDFKDAAILAKGSKYFKLGNNINISSFNHFYPLSSTSNHFNGTLDGDGKTISNMNLGCGEYCGFVGNLNGGKIKNISFSNSSVTNYRGTGRTGLVAGSSVSSNITFVNIYNSTVSGNVYTGGVTGYNDGTVLAINYRSGSVTGSSPTGGIVGHNNGTVREVTVRCSVTGTSSYTGGVVGMNGRSVSTFQQAPGYIYNALVNANITGSGDTGGMVGRGYKNYLYGVVEGGTITGTGSTSNIIGSNDGDIYKVTYVSSGVIVSSQNGYTGTIYNAEEGSLDLYEDIKFNSNQPLLESSTTGDVNGSGYWFTTESDGKIYVVAAGSGPVPPPPDPGCEPNCPVIEKVGEVAGTCPSGDVTPPVCVFETFGGVTNGVRAKFYCTDETSVPTIASMFNSTTKQAYTFAQITDSTRGGTVKTGKVSGTTRRVDSQWTTTNSPQNPPSPNLCYYYQFAAKDACGNESDWVTSTCWQGFAN